MAKDEIKPYTVEDLASLVRERNYHKSLLEGAQRDKKVAQARLDQTVSDEEHHFKKFQEYENKILSVAKNLKG